jgi:peptidyl-prolyl cis-trans isomerase B (cyclophilin B)
MRKRYVGFFMATLAFSACDHKPGGQAQAEAGRAGVVRNDSDLTGEPPIAQPASKPGVYPRALPVTLPIAASPPPPTSIPPASASPAATNAAPVADLTTLPSPSTTPDAGNPGSAPATSPDPNSSMTRLEINPPTPVITTPPPAVMDEAEARKQVVVLETSLGRIVIQLDDVSAPRTCGNFRKLVSDGFYNHTVFHRVIPNFMIQGGDPNSKSDDRGIYGQGDPGYTLPAEIKLKATAGAVAMARLPDAVNPQRDSNGSQFFICVADCPSLDNQYTVFGHVISGLETAIKIAGQPRDKRDNPMDRIEIDASLETKKQALEQSSVGP